MEGKSCTQRSTFAFFHDYLLLQFHEQSIIVHFLTSKFFHHQKFANSTNIVELVHSSNQKIAFFEKKLTRFQKTLNLLKKWEKMVYLL